MPFSLSGVVLCYTRETYIAVKNGGQFGWRGLGPCRARCHIYRVGRGVGKESGCAGLSLASAYAQQIKGLIKKKQCSRVRGLWAAAASAVPRQESAFIFVCLSVPFSIIMQVDCCHSALSVIKNMFAAKRTYSTNDKHGNLQEVCVKRGGSCESHRVFRPDISVAGLHARRRNTVFNVGFSTLM